MTIRLFNTLTKTKEDFTPIDAKNVRMYVCGPTVYDFAHIGNARPVIVFDVLYRLLRHEYGEGHVTYVRNITDVDDKINARALRDFPGLPLNEAIRAVTEKTEAQYHADVAALGCLPPTHEPRATENIPGMIVMIQSLLDKGYAYVAQGDEGREALFDIRRMDDYGRLSGRKLDEQLAGARIEAKDYKRNPGDFVLWKESNSNEPGWDATFQISDADREQLRVNSNSIGIRGRPGWHIECSVMSAALLGDTFDIHGGGLDLIFPHHENEIAQSRCAHGTPVMANVWMHNGFLQVEGEKMSKSLGNFLTINELLDLRPGDALRLTMLRTNYNQPIDWTNDGVLNSLDCLRQWAELVAFTLGEACDLTQVEGVMDQGVLDALSDNLNTHLALVKYERLFEDARKDKALIGSFVKTGLFLGFRNLNKPGFFHHTFSAFEIESGPKIASVGAVPFLKYRAAVANSVSSAASFAIQAAKLREDLESRGFVLQINDAGVLQVENTTGADFETLIKNKIAERLAAKKEKNFAKADKIRQELLQNNKIELEDKPDGSTVWRVMR